jgi:hypothetical protein
MSTVAEFINQALAMPAPDRARIAQALLDSLPHPPRFVCSEAELGKMLQSRIEAVQSGVEQSLDSGEALRRAREAVRQVRP